MGTESVETAVTAIPVVALMLLFVWQARQLAVIIETTQEARMAIVDDLKSVKDQLVKAQGEIAGKITALEDALAAASVADPDVEAAVTELRSVAQALDDVVPDAPVEEEVPAEVPVEVPAEVEGEPVEAEVVDDAPPAQ